MKSENRPPRVMPDEYRGREQTWIKHEVLTGYAEKWAHKLASVVRKGKIERLWFVDCFAGPWESRDELFRDTSPAIALRVLNEVKAIHEADGDRIEFGAIFVEKNPVAFKELDRFVTLNRGGVKTITLEGEFESHIPRIHQLLGDDPALLFVDPLGWRDIRMMSLQPLVAKPRRDVLINVMSDHMNRFKSDIAEFFACDVPQGLNEDGMMALYAKQLREVCCLEFVADLIIEYPTVDRTYYRLVVGGHHEEVVRLFRDIESKVAKLVPQIRAQAREQNQLNKTGQSSFLSQITMPTEGRYESARRDALLAARGAISVWVRQRRPLTFEEISHEALQTWRMTERDLKTMLVDMVEEGALEVVGMEHGKRTLKGEHIICVGSGKPTKRYLDQLAEGAQQSLF